jgi:hypothetical protein
MKMAKKNSNPCIKHKLWGELKAEAKAAYKIFPVEGCNLWRIKYWSQILKSYEIPDISHPSDWYETLEEAKEKLEKLRTQRFYYLCEKALYERKLLKVKNL